MKKFQNRLIKILLIIIVVAGALLYFNSNDGNPSDDVDPSSDVQVEYHFRNNDLLSDHYKKHGIEMGFNSKEDYEKAASDVVNNPNALHKIEKEDGDDVYYIEDSNEFVVVSTDGYIRTYFLPDSGKKYFDKQ